MDNIAIIDNYDSFTFNLVHLIEQVTDAEIDVFLNDKFEVNELDKYSSIIISPGPGLPQQAGKTMQVIDKYFTKKNILGVCLGHQAIGEYFGAKLKNLTEVYHGKSSIINIKNDIIFANIEKPLVVGRYHSWVIANTNLPNCLKIIATDENENIMAIRHNSFNIVGVQFHPESIMTNCGKQLLKNWLHNK